MKEEIVLKIELLLNKNDIEEAKNCAKEYLVDNYITDKISKDVRNYLFYRIWDEFICIKDITNKDIEYDIINKYNDMLDIIYDSKDSVDNIFSADII